MTLRLAEDKDRQLTEVAQSLGLSKQQAVEAAVEQFLERESQDAVLGGVFAMVRKRDRVLLERLADS